MQIETKADVGQTIFYMHNGKAQELIVEKIEIVIGKNTIGFNYTASGINYLREDEIFLSRKKLADYILKGVICYV